MQQGLSKVNNKYSLLETEKNNKAYLLTTVKNIDRDISPKSLTRRWEEGYEGR